MKLYIFSVFIILALLSQGVAADSAYTRHLADTSRGHLETISVTTDSGIRSNQYVLGQTFRYNQLFFKVTGIEELESVTRHGVREVFVPDGKYIHVTLEITNNDVRERFYSSSGSIWLQDENGMNYRRAPELPSDIGLTRKRHDPFLEPGEVRKASLTFDVDEAATTFSLNLKLWTLPPVTVDLGSPEAIIQEEQADACATSNFLIFGKNGEYEVGLSHLETKDFGKRGLVTSAVVYAKKSSKDTSWRPYDIEVQSGKRHIDVGGRSIYTLPIERTFNPNGDCFTAELITRELPVDDFDEEQIVYVILKRAKKTVVSGRGELDLRTFA